MTDIRRPKRVAGAPIKVRSVAELRKHERAIVAHINAMPNGGMLFSIDPLRLLHDIGVTVHPDLKKVIELAHPEIGRTGGPAYDHLVASEHPQRAKITFRGLFDLGAHER